MVNWRNLGVAFCPVLALDVAIYLLSGRLVLVEVLHGVIALCAYLFYILVKVGRTGKLSQAGLAIEQSTASENAIRLFALINFAASILLAVLLNAGYAA